MTRFASGKYRPDILRIVVIYALVGGVWIYASGSALEMFVRDASIRISLEILKGFGFVAVTSLLMYLLISRYVQQLEASRESLRETDEQLRSALAASRMGVWAWNLRTNAVFWSPECYDIVGLKDFNGSFEAFAELIHPDDKERVMETVSHSLAVDNAYTDEFRIIRPDGRLCWLLNHGRVTYDAEGAPLLLSGTVQDITEQKIMGEMLKESEERFRSIVENSPNMIMIHADGKYVYLNPAAVRSFGIADQQEYIGKPIIEAVHPDFRGCVRERINTIYRDNQPALKSEQKLLRKDGSSFWAEITGIPTVYNGHKSVQVIAIDITARKQYEADLRGYSHRLIELDENLRKHLAAELHDEIGRDLTAIGMNLAVIGTSVADTEPVKVGEKIRDTVKLTENISRTVRGIMAGLRPPVLDDFGLLAALRWHSRSFSERTGVVIDVLADDSFPRLAAEKETALFRIAQEALMNAAKHADVHSVTIMLKVCDETIRLAIADQGKGFMAGIAGDSPREGSGWGLKIMRERAEAIGGHFQVESAAGGGTAVTVTVPVKEV
jgi:PAS domain S-box-containing protein